MGSLVPGLSNIEPRLPAHIINSLEGIPPHQVIKSHDPKLIAAGLPPYPPVLATLDARTIEEIRRTVLVSEVGTLTSQQLIDHFCQAGEVKYMRFCERDIDKAKFALIEMTEQETIIKALQLNESNIEGQVIKVHHSIQAICKPQAKSNEAAQREIEEAMCRVKEAQHLISAAIDPVIGMLSKDKRSDGAHEAMLSGAGDKAPKLTYSQTKKKDDYEALQSFLRSISSTATLPPYIKGETYSSVRGVFNQCLITCAVLIIAAGAGHPIGFSAIALPQLRKENSTMRIDEEMGSWIASIHSASTPLGSLLSGPVMEAFGRRRTLQLCILPLIVGWVIIGTAVHHAVLLLGRVLCGFAVGIMAAPSQVYLGEIAEPRLRGLLIGTPFVAYSLGVLYVYALGGAMDWRSVALLSIVLPAFAFLALCFSPESPTWLARRGRFHEAMAAMSRLRGSDDTAQRELHELISAREKEKARGEENIKFFATISRAPVLKPLLLINAFNMLQILSGSYVVIFYAHDIVEDTGGAMDAKVAANASALVRLCVTVVACVLLLRITRRALVLASGAGTALCTLALAFLMSRGQGEGWLPPALILGYVGFNTLGFFVLPGLMIGELLPTRVRGLLGGYIFCLFNAVLFGFTKAYPQMKYHIGMGGVFGIFGASATLATIILYLLLPETKGKSLIQIEEYYQKPNILWLTRNSGDGQRV